MQVNIETAVRTGHDDLIIMTEYNPAIEKFKTGNMMLNIYTWILNGWIAQVMNETGSTWMQSNSAQRLINH